MADPKLQTPLIITISGDVGGGKSVLADRLVRRFDADRYSTGTVQRNIAKRMGITTLELNQLAETDKSIDDQIDGVFKALAKTRKNLVVDSRMAWHFLPMSFKIKLEVAPEIAAQRISKDNTRVGEGDISAAVILKSILDRRVSETERFKRYYDADISAKENYDLVVNSFAATPDAIEATVMECIEAWRADKPFERHWVAPKSLIPTQSLSDIPEGELGKSLPKLGEWGDAMPEIAEHDGFPYIVSGHAEVFSAIRGGYALIPVREVAAAKAPQSDAKIVEAWEKEARFAFERLPHAPKAA